jgi:hypothetical protein
MSAFIVYITTTKRIKQYEKPHVDYFRILTFHFFFVGVYLGDGGWGIRINRFIMYTVFGSSKIQFSKSLAKGQLSRIGG